MAFSEVQFSTFRPYLYHLTDARNLRAITADRRLDCSKTLLDRAGRSEVLRARRIAHLPLQINGTNTWLRDQLPLHRKNVQLEDGFSFEDLVSSLNERVFFWPGHSAGPIDYGRRHYARYSSEGPAVLRVPTSSLFLANASRRPLFSCVNVRVRPRPP